MENQTRSTVQNPKNLHDLYRDMPPDALSRKDPNAQLVPNISPLRSMYKDRPPGMLSENGRTRFPGDTTPPSPQEQAGVVVSVVNGHQSPLVTMYKERPPSALSEKGLRRHPHDTTPDTIHDQRTREFEQAVLLPPLPSVPEVTRVHVAQEMPAPQYIPHDPQQPAHAPQVPQAQYQPPQPQPAQVPAQPVQAQPQPQPQPQHPAALARETVPERLTDDQMKIVIGVQNLEQECRTASWQLEDAVKKARGYVTDIERSVHRGEQMTSQLETHMQTLQQTMAQLQMFSAQINALPAMYAALDYRRFQAMAWTGTDKELTRLIHEFGATPKKGKKEVRREQLLGLLAERFDVRDDHPDVEPQVMGEASQEEESEG